MQLAAQQSRLASHRLPVLPVRTGTAGRRRAVQARAVLDTVEHASTLAQALASGHSLHSLASHAATLAYEPIALPCSLQRCGDIVHRATLDPVLRKEVTGIPWQTYALLATVSLYLFATPGVVQGWWDYYIIAPLQRRLAPNVITKEDIKLGKKLGSGGFGSVYKGELLEEDGSTTAVVVKKAKEFGEAEVWMNERMMRFAPEACARFLTAFADQGTGPRKEDACIWLVWKDEGEDTLYDLILKREWPYNLEPLLVGRELRLPRGKRRKLVTIRLAMRQLLQALKACHATGIVHRDIKPQNVIVSPADRRLKLIDLGAAADLRIGINYVPNEYLLDPRYAPPQQYVMSTQTPKPPPKPVAALLSPVLWRMENPDRFDMYSAGITLLQMALPNLRSGNNLIAFNRRLEAADYDLRRWRREETARKPSKELEEGFELLDCDDGAGWELACKLVAYSPGERFSAADALNHRWFDAVDDPSAAPSLNGTLSRTVGTVTTMAASVGKNLDSVLPPNLLSDAIAHGSGDGLSEAELARMFGYNRAGPAAPRNASQTIAWFQGRQSELQRKVEERSQRLVRTTRRSIRDAQRALLPWSILSSSKPNAGAPMATADAQPQQKGAQQRSGGQPKAANSNGRGGKAAAGNAGANGKPAAAAAAFNGSAGKQGVVRVLAPAPPADTGANGNANGNGNGAGEVVARKKERFAVFGGRR